MTKSSNPAALSHSPLHTILTANSSGSSIILKSTFTILFFLSTFFLIGAYNFIDHYPGQHPSQKRIATLTYLSVQSAFFFAGMVLPWKLILYPFRSVLEADQDVELQTLGVDERNLYALEYYQEPDNEAPPPLMKRTFTVLKTTLRPSNSFRVLGARKGVETPIPSEAITVIRPGEPQINRNPTANSGRTRTPSARSSRPSRNPSTVTRHPSNPSKMTGARRTNSNRSLRTPQPIVRITHPLESLTAHQPHNKLDFTNPPPLSRRNTGGSDRSYRTREAYELENRKEISDTLKKLEGIRLSTVGEDHERYSQMMSGLELETVAQKDEVPELSDGESDRESGSSSSCSSSFREEVGDDAGNFTEGIENVGTLEEAGILGEEGIPLRAISRESSREISRVES